MTMGLDSMYYYTLCIYVYLIHMCKYLGVLSHINANGNGNTKAIYIYVLIHMCEYMCDTLAAEDLNIYL